MSTQRGPLPLSEDLALRYTAVPQDDGAALVLWSGGLMAEPTLYARRVDARGLITQAALTLAHGADWPAAVQANDGTIHLFWWDTVDQTLRYGRLNDGQISGEETIDTTFTLSSGDRLDSMAAGLDTGSDYLLWNLTRRDGSLESGMVTRALDASGWTQVPRLGIADTDGNAPAAGLNTGPITAAQAGERWLAWVAPLPGQFDLMPIAAASQGDLMLVYLHAGEIVGSQRAAGISGLLRPPTLRTDRDRYLYLAWADPLENAPAAMNLLTTRP